MNKPNQIARLHTSCQDCIFAQYEKTTQTGCNIDKLETYRDNNNIYKTRHINSDIQITEVYDNKQEFFVLNNIKCHYKRTEQWGKKVNKDNWKERVKEENRIKYQVIIFSDNNLDDIKITTQSLLDQSIPPQHITIIRKLNNTIRPSIISHYLNTLSIPWRIENVIDEELTNYDIIDTILKTRPYPYYFVCYAWMIIPSDFFETINTKIYDKHLKFALLIDPVDNDDNLPVLTSTSIHYTLRGNNPTSLLEKLRKDKCDSLIINIQDIYPNYPK